MTTPRRRREYRRRAVQSARDARKRTGRKGFDWTKEYSSRVIQPTRAAAFSPMIIDELLR